MLIRVDDDPEILHLMIEMQLKLLHRRNKLGFDLGGKKRRMRDTLLRNRFEGYTENARLVMTHGLGINGKGQGPSCHLSDNLDPSSILNPYQPRTEAQRQTRSTHGGEIFWTCVHQPWDD